MTKLKMLIVLFYILCSSGLAAQITLPHIIGSNMVLQRDQPVPIWGWCKPGHYVRVKFADQITKAQAGPDGYWKVILNKLHSSAEPREMQISADTTTVKLKNILVGEVWLCSGQSNMEYRMKRVPSVAPPGKGIDSAEIELNTINLNIRLFKVERTLSTPDVTTTGWNTCKGSALAQMSAVGYFFAKNLQKKLNVPIGIISSAWSGSRIESWTPQAAYEALPDIVKETTQSRLLADSITQGAYYKSMIAPLAPFALKGFLWYQGEANCMPNQPEMSYAYKMQALITSWRDKWGNAKLPFYSTLIAPYYYSKRKKPSPYSKEILPEFWEQQVRSTQIPNTGIITVTDLVDDLENIHPSYKWEVGRRFALLTLNKTYDLKEIVCSGPVYQGMHIENKEIRINFTNSLGLKTNDGLPPGFFTIAGSDGEFVDAEAKIEGQTIIVSNPSVNHPVQVRLGWTEIARLNLVNGAGLPAIPFRTDGIRWHDMKH